MTRILFAVDVDNTIVDNDGLLARLAADLRAMLPPGAGARFWELYEAGRRETGVASPTDAAARLGRELGVDAGRRAAAAVGAVAPARHLYPRALEVLAHLRTLGTVVILSDGDGAYQTEKIERAGLARVVDDVLVLTRKEEHVLELTERYPADAYVFIDDKPTVLDAIRRRLPDAFLIHVRQGKYSAGSDAAGTDLAVGSIAVLAGLQASEVLTRVRTS